MFYVFLTLFYIRRWNSKFVQYCPGNDNISHVAAFPAAYTL